jgi:hypothetical protein
VKDLIDQGAIDQGAEQVKVLGDTFPAENRHFRQPPTAKTMGPKHT